MARKAIEERAKKIVNVCLRFKDRRIELKEKIRLLEVEPADNYVELQELRGQLRKQPRNASATRIRRRCNKTGRGRGVYKKVGLSKGMFRLYAMLGHIPGLRKASW